MIDIRWDPEPWASLRRWLAPLPGQYQPPDPDLALADLDQLLEVVRITFEGLSMPLAAPERFVAETPASADLIQLWANLVAPGTVVVVGFDVWPSGTYPIRPGGLATKRSHWVVLRQHGPAGHIPSDRDHALWHLLSAVNLHSDQLLDVVAFPKFSARRTSPGLL